MMGEVEYIIYRALSILYGPLPNDPFDIEQWLPLEEEE